MHQQTASATASSQLAPASQAVGTSQPEALPAEQRGLYLHPLESLRLSAGDGYIQRKLSVGNPDDEFEQEADTMADTVMRKAQIPFVQRKCADCEKEEQVQRKTITPFIQKKGEATTTVSDAVSSQIQASRGSGNALPQTTKSFMENSFGTDFSSVKIHTDSQAADLSQQLNAQAFTVGNDIYFNQGKFNPASESGQHLLAHELTHTLQQSNQIRRVPNPSFAIEGLFEDRSAHPDFVFFGMNEPNPTVANLPDSIDADERRKIEDKADSNPPAIHLFGFASEESSVADSNSLINRRVQAVQQVLIARSYPATQISVASANQRRLARNHPEYRFWRAVEMASSGTSTRRPPGGSRRGVGPCATTRRNETDTARQEAIGLLGTVITRLGTYATTSPPTDTDAQNALTFYFRNSTPGFVRDRILPNLRAIRRFLNRMMRILHCGTPLSVDCGNADALTNPSSITLCEGFFTSSYTSRQQALILIHEAGHGTGRSLGDRSYRNERVFHFLSTRQALRNTESFMILVEELTSGARPSDIVSPARDTLSGCDANPTLRDHTREAIAWAERLNTYAIFGIQQTYGQPENTAFMTPFFMATFGRADRAAMAGILDRYLQMDQVFGQPLSITCADATQAVCTATPPLPIWTLAGTVTVCPHHLSQSTQRQRVNQMYAGLAAILPGVTAAQQFSYPRLARIYKDEFWQERG